jgi:pimeloyl-ACP methyl ester carboxylesterase
LMNTPYSRGSKIFLGGQAPMLIQNTPPALFGRSMAQAVFSRQSLEKNPSLADYAVSAMTDCHIQSAANAADCVLRLRKPLWDLLPTYRGRALVASGSEDRVVPTRHAVGAAEKLADAELVVFDDVGHCAALEATEELAMHICRLAGAA